MSYASGGTVSGVFRLRSPALAPSLAAAGEGRMYFDGTVFQVSQNGAAYAALATAGTGGGWTDDGTVVRLTTVTDGLGVGIAGIAADSKLEVLGDATRINVSVTGGAPGGAATGGSIVVTAGAGGTSGVGGATSLIGGAGGSSGGGTGGALVLRSGNALSSNSGSGAVTLASGTSPGVTGVVTVHSGDGGATGFAGGAVTIRTGDGGSAAGFGIITGALSLSTGSVNVASNASVGAISIAPGTGRNGGAPGSVTIAGGAHTASTGGAISLAGGTSSGGGGAGGAASLVGGAGNAAGAGGTAVLAGGAAGASGAGGALSITSGAGGVTSGASGAISVATGVAVDGAGGSISIAAASGATTTATARNGGSVQITAGLAVSGGVNGTLRLQVGATNYTWPTTVGAAGSVLSDAAGNGTLSWAAASASSLAATLAVGNTTGANDIIVTGGQRIVGGNPSNTLVIEGAAATSGTGGQVLMIGANGFATGGAGGQVRVLAGEAAGDNAVTDNFNGGDAVVSSGIGFGLGRSGGLILRTDSAGVRGRGGDMDVITGSGGSSAASGAGRGGTITITAGNAQGVNNNSGGSIFAQAGRSAGTAQGGNFSIIAGEADGSGLGGDVEIDAGASASGTRGQVLIGTVGVSTSVVTLGNNAATTTVNLVAGTTSNMTFTARGGSITLNQVGNTALVGFTATSVVGALNELKATGAESLAATLVAGNTTGANNISVNTGQKILGAAELTLDGTTVLNLQTAATTRWTVDATGHLLAGADNAYDVGAVGARPRRVYAGTEVIVGNTVTIGTASVAGSAALSVDAAAALTLGGTTATSVAVGRTGVTTTVPGALAVTQASTFTGLTTHTAGIAVGAAQAITGAGALTVQSTAALLTLASTGGITLSSTAGGNVNVNAIDAANPNVNLTASGHIQIDSANQNVRLRTNATTRWEVTNAGDLIAGSDNAYNIGAIGASRPSRVYVATEVVVGATVTIGTATISGSANLTIDTGAAGTLNLGNTNATTVTIGSGATAVTMPGNLTVSGNLTVNGTTTTVNSTNLTVTDPLIYANNGGANPSFAGLAWDQGAALDVITVWNPTNSRMEFGRFNTVGGTTVPSSALTTLSDIRAANLSLGTTASVTGDTSLTLTATAGSAIVNGSSSIEFQTGGSARWDIDGTGMFRALSDNAYDVGAVGARPRRVYAGTEVIVGSTVTIGTGSITGSAALAINSTATWIGSTNTAPIQIGRGDNGTFDAAAGDIVIQAAPSVSATNYVAVFGQKAAGGFPGGYVDIIAGGGSAGLAAGDTFIRGGYADTGSAAGALFLRGGDGNASVSAGAALCEGGQTTAVAGFGGDLTLRGGDNPTTPANSGRVLIGNATTRSVTIGAAGITTTTDGVSDLTGAVALGAIATVTGNTTLGATNAIVLVDATAGAITITLPAVAGVTRRHYTIKKIDATANTVTIDGNGAETIDGAATRTVIAQYESLEIVSNGTAWFIV